MKLKDFETVATIKRDLDQMARRRERLIAATSFRIIGAEFSVDLAAQDELSEIRRAFDSVKREALYFVDRQIDEARRSLQGLGVES